jgi:hypothetical protein
LALVVLVVLLVVQILEQSEEILIFHSLTHLKQLVEVTVLAAQVEAEETAAQAAVLLEAKVQRHYKVV